MKFESKYNIGDLVGSHHDTGTLVYTTVARIFWSGSSGFEYELSDGRSLKEDKITGKFEVTPVKSEIMPTLKRYQGLICETSVEDEDEYRGYLAKNKDGSIRAVSSIGKQFNCGILLDYNGSTCFNVNPVLGFKLDSKGCLIPSEVERIKAFFLEPAKKGVEDE